MSNFLDPMKAAFRQAMEDSLAKSEEERIHQAFFNGIAVGLFVGTVLASIGWIAFFWLASLAK